MHGVYIHVPWCRTRCPYCAFYVVVSNERDPLGWARRVLLDWEEEAPYFAGGLHSIFFGGGTPSALPMGAVAHVLLVLPPAAEVTLETNPGDLSPELLMDAIGAGVNRISVGVQTFDPRFARLLNRGHTVDQARELLMWVRAAPLRSWSVDIIFGLPGQTADDVRTDLDAILALEPPHVSLYGLTLDHDTPLTRAVREGRVPTPDPDVWADQFALCRETLGSRGWEQYEISNFARPGHRAVHNEAVWRGGHYAGLGPSAHGFRPDGTRTVRPADLARWLEGAPASLEVPTPEEAAMDRVLTTLRHRDGLDLVALEPFRVDAKALHDLEAHGLATLRGRHLVLEPKGVPVADAVVRTVCQALRLP